MEKFLILVLIFLIFLIKMIEVNPTIEIQGANFSPRKVNEIIETCFINENEVGEIGTKGRYKDKAIPFGYASLSCKSKGINAIHEDQIISLLKYLQTRISVIRDCGGDRIELNISYTFKDQCNEEISLESIRLLALMEIPFTFSVYKK